MSSFYPCATELALKYHMNRNEPCRTCKDWARNDNYFQDEDNE